MQRYIPAHTLCLLSLIGTLFYIGCDSSSSGANVNNNTSGVEYSETEGGAHEEIDDRSPEDMDSMRMEEMNLIIPRTPRRITVEQLVRSIPITTGGVRWVEDFGQGPVDILELLAPTLGAPDYLKVTEEQLEADILFSKFIQDGAQRVCWAWVERDQRAESSERTLVKPSPSITAWDSLERSHIKYNISRLLLRFFAYTVSDPDRDERLLTLTQLFQDVSAVSPQTPAKDGWFTVCLALMTDPEYIIY